MNWTCLVYGALMLGVTIWWIVDARKWFKGPKVYKLSIASSLLSFIYFRLSVLRVDAPLRFPHQVNIKHQMLGREGSVLEGVANERDSTGSSAGSLIGNEERKAQRGVGGELRGEGILRG